MAPVAGGDIARGLYDGMSSYEVLIKRLGGGLARAALRGARTRGEMRSPSRLFFREVGFPIAEGVALGIGAHLPDVLEAGRGIVSGLAELDFSLTAQDGPGGFDVRRQVETVRAGLAVPHLPGTLPEPRRQEDGPGLDPLLEELRRLREDVGNLQANVTFEGGIHALTVRERKLVGAIPKAIRRQHYLGKF